MKTWTLLTLGLTACTVEPPEPRPGDGTLELTWQIGTSGCELSDVSTVRVEVADISRDVACAEGGVSLAVPEGTWSVDLQGLDPSDVPRYGGEVLAVQVMEGESTSAPTVLLGALPATLTVTWYFENGRLCGGNGVSDVEITLFDDDYIVDSWTTPCDDGIETYQGVIGGDYTVHIMGQDSQGTVQYTGNTQVELAKGDITTVEVELIEN